jgi:hypothetical protein
MTKNVVLPLFLLVRTVDLLKELKPSQYNEVRFEYEQVLRALETKMWKIECQKSYHKIVLDGDSFNDYLGCIDCAKVRLLSGEINFEDDSIPVLPF